ncbi:2'-5' RNA ligase [Deinococcus peraridilitoris DSM 19664]|uniref:2'-5' RNA ligase n=1 Tax=Deinococcus peraridilitoris (strain DSM 19664 / LMG 22246 / CIP 109416 / KR-200) TaxID=937777 RepID=K9ZZV6_DEIPD|nr:2'-5' RNA ligase [Deinococcus peraridilitoris DSM 19664]
MLREKPMPGAWQGIPADRAAHGVIIVLGVPPEIARALEVPGGVSGEQLHLTLVSLGSAHELGEGRLEAVRETLRTFAARTSALRARVTGVGRFSVSQGNDVAYVSVDAPELSALRESLLCDLAQDAGLEAEYRHGFTPHITVAFIAPGQAHPYERVEPLELHFSTLELWTGPRHDVFSLGNSASAAAPCEAAQAAEDSIGAAASIALEAVARDWIGLVATRLHRSPPRERVRIVQEAFDHLHTRVLAAHLAAPARAWAGMTPEATLEARAARLRSVETDLTLIFETAAKQVLRDLPTTEAVLPVEEWQERLRASLTPLFAWASTDEVSFG